MDWALHKIAHVPKDEPTYLTSVQVCQDLGIDRSTLTRWVQAGRIAPAMRIGGNKAYLFRPSEVARAAATTRRTIGGAA